MKLCMVSATYPDIHCGVGDFVGVLCPRLAQEGIDVHVLTSRDPRVRPSEENPRVHPTLEAWGWRQAPALIRAVQELRPDLVHIQYETLMYRRSPMIELFPLLLKRAGFRGPVIFSPHEFHGPHLFTSRGLRADLQAMNPRYLPTFVGRGEFLWELRCRAMVQQSDVVAVTNEPLLEHLRREFPSRARRIVLTPLSSIVPDHSGGEDRGETRRRLGLAPGEVLLVYFGFLRPEKRVEMVLDAFSSLAHEALPVRLLVIAGQGGVGDSYESYRTSLRQRFASLGADGRAHWYDYVPYDELATLLQAADVAVLPIAGGVSWRRSSFLACLRHGLAVVTTRGEHTPPEVEDREHALLVPPDDQEALTGALRQVIADGDLRHRLRAGAQTLFKRRDWNQVVKSNLETYELALRTRGGKGTR